MIGGGVEIETVSAPTLARLRDVIFARPVPMQADPFVVAPEAWQMAKGELEAQLSARGWALSSDDKLKRQGCDNFLYCGVPIVVMRDG